jgi:hypothetical protein
VASAFFAESRSRVQVELTPAKAQSPAQPENLQYEEFGKAVKTIVLF